jgi:hypothetical protein
MRCVLNSRNVHLSNTPPSKPTLKNWMHLKIEGFLYSKYYGILVSNKIVIVLNLVALPPKLEN